MEEKKDESTGNMFLRLHTAHDPMKRKRKAQRGERKGERRKHGSGGDEGK